MFIGIGLGLQRPASAAWTPKALSPLAWYDPSDLSTLWQDTAGTVPVTASGQSVARIDDKSGNGYHLMQPTAGSRPSYQTSGGLHWLQGDGTADNMKATIPNYSGNAATLAAAVQGASNNFLGMIHATGLSGPPVRFTTHAPFSTSVYFDFANSAAGRLSTPQTFTSPHVVLMRGGAARIGRVDGTTVVSGGVAPTPASAYDTIILGDGVAPFAPLKTYGLVILQREITDAEMPPLETYLAAKSGVTLA